MYRHDTSGDELERWPGILVKAGQVHSALHRQAHRGDGGQRVRLLADHIHQIAGLGGVCRDVGGSGSSCKELRRPDFQQRTLSRPKTLHADREYGHE